MRRRGVITLGLVLALASPGCSVYRRDLEPAEDRGRASRPQPEPAAPLPQAKPVEPAAPDDMEPETPAGLARAFPGVRVDAERRVVEFDARVSPLIFEPYEGRFFYLEQFVCKAGTKDHESLVVTDVAPSQIHAALLLIGLEPGSPVVWEHPEGRPVPRPAAGPEVDVLFVLSAGEAGGERLIDPRDWTTEKNARGRFPEGRWVFAGSAIAGTADAAFYEADAAGTIVGLASFGTEVIAWPRPISHEEAEGEMEWVADLGAMPAAETPLVVRVVARGE